MSAAPTPRPVRRPTRYTFVAEGGQEDGIDVGDRFTVEFEGEQYDVKVVDSSEHKSVLETVDTGLESYGKRSIANILQRS